MSKSLIDKLHHFFQTILAERCVNPKAADISAYLKSFTQFSQSLSEDTCRSRRRRREEITLSLVLSSSPPMCQFDSLCIHLAVRQRFLVINIHALHNVYLRSDLFYDTRKIIPNSNFQDNVTLSKL